MEGPLVNQPPVTSLGDDNLSKTIGQPYLFQTFELLPA